MTNAEMAKQTKEFNERLDRYYENQEETINKYDDKIVHLHNELEELAERVNGLGIVAQETTRQLKEQVDRLDRYRDVLDNQFANYDANIGHLNERLDGCDEYQGLLNDKLEGIEKRLDSMSDATTYVRQVAEDSKKIEDALKVTTRKLDLFSQKNMELMERNKRLSEQNVKLQEDVKASNKMCDAVSKKASKLADRVQKLEADSSRVLRLESIEQRLNSMDDTTAYVRQVAEKMARPILFSGFNAGKMAIVFNGNDPLFEAAYIVFCRAFDEWCSTRKTEDKLIPQSEWPSQIHRMDPFMKCPSIYKDRSSFAIWTEHSEEGANHTFEYGTLMTNWREHNTVGGLPYTVWRA